MQRENANQMYKFVIYLLSYTEKKKLADIIEVFLSEKSSLNVVRDCDFFLHVFEKQIPYEVSTPNCKASRIESY